jgi:Mrp family chromosome partitioning ATPase
LQEKLREVRQRFDELKAREKALPGLMAAAERELVDAVPAEVVQASAKGPAVDPQETDLTTVNGVYAAIAAQALRLRFELESPPRVRELQSASTPSLKDGKKQVLATVAAGLFGFALVGAGVVATEFRAKRVCSLAELTAATPAPVVGVIPAVPPTADPAARAAAAEAMDKLRSRVAQTFLARGATTVAVTSAIGDEGKALTAFGLASSLALAGFKTLLLDFDLRSPALHPHAGVPNQDGVCELLTGAVDHRRAMIVLANGLHFVPAGAFSEDARAAAVGDRLAGLIASLSQPFDCVVLHGHPLLAAAEAVEVARRADAVLLCGTFRDTRLPLLKRAVDRLAVMEVPHAGIVYLGATTHEALC